MTIRRPSLRTIARACGCSVATVSMALRNMARVPPAVRARIEREAIALGYVRDSEMSRLMSRARRSVHPASVEQLAFLADVPLDQDAPSSHRWLQRMFASASETARLLGSSLKPVLVTPAATQQRAVGRSLRAQGIRGILVGPVTAWKPASLAMDWSGFAAVELGSTLHHPSIHRIERDYHEDLLDLYARLHATGYRRMGLALSPVRLDILRHVPESTLLFFRQDHPDQAPVLPLHRHGAWTSRGFRAWMEDQKPDVVLVFERHVVAWMEAAGLKVPCDLGLVHLDSQGGAESGLIPDTDLMAREAVHLLTRLVNNGEWGLPRRPRSHRFRNIFNPGATIAAPPGS